MINVSISIPAQGLHSCEMYAEDGNQQKKKKQRSIMAAEKKHPGVQALIDHLQMSRNDYVIFNCLIFADNVLEKSLDKTDMSFGPIHVTFVAEIE